MQTGGTLFGVGSVSGAINSSGTITPGDSATSAGILKDTGAYTQASGGVLDVFIGGTTAGTQYDQLNVTTASLAGKLNILPSSFVPAIGAKFTIMNFVAASGSLTPGTGFAINGSEHYALSCGTTSCVITVAAGALSPAALKPVILSSTQSNMRLASLWTARGSSMPGLSFRGFSIDRSLQQRFNFSDLRRIAVGISASSPWRASNVVGNQWNFASSWSAASNDSARVAGVNLMAAVHSGSIRDSFVSHVGAAWSNNTGRINSSTITTSPITSASFGFQSRLHKLDLSGVSGGQAARIFAPELQTKLAANGRTLHFGGAPRAGVQGRTVVGGFSMPIAKVVSKPQFALAMR